MKNVGRAVVGLVALGGVLAGCAGSDNPWPKSRSQIVKMAPACEDFAVQIYFETESAALTSEARSLLKGAEDLTKGCKVASVRVIGLADAKGGAPDSNLALSKKRADTVTRALAKMGLKADFEVGAAGDAGAVTSSGEARPLRRRADIKFDLDGPLR